MGTQIVIPNIGESVTSGVIAAWSVKDGDYVERDQTVLELETDKVTMEVPAPAAGVVKHSASEGDEVEVGAVVGEIDESAEKSGSSGSSKKSDKAEKSEDGGDKSDGGGTATAEKPEKKEREPEDTEGDGSDADKGPGSKDEKKDRESEGSDEKDSRESRDRSGSEKKQTSSSGVHKATPLARKLAEDSGIDLGTISGTGAGGRIREQDVLASIQTRRNGAASKPAESGKSSSGGARSVKQEKMSPMRQRIASRLVEAQQTAAMLTTFNEVDMGAVMDLRKQFKEDFEKKHGIGLGFMSFFVKASVQALRKFPLINAYITGGDDGKPVIEKHDYQDVAIAVAGPKGLVVPVIRNAEDMSFAEIESAIKDFGARAKDGKLELSEMTGGTFTITNGGVFGSLMSTPILNPPQSAILGMHTIKKRPVEYPEKSGQMALRPMMYLALSYDHRIVDGAEAVQFLVSIKNAIEDPARLMLDL